MKSGIYYLIGFLIIFVFASNSMAQDRWEYTFWAGANTSQTEIDEFVFVPFSNLNQGARTIDYGSRQSYSLGLTARRKLSNSLGLVGELSFVNYGYTRGLDESYMLPVFGDVFTIPASESITILQYIKAPIMLSYQLPFFSNLNPEIAAGPYFSVQVAEKYRATTFDDQGNVTRKDSRSGIFPGSGIFSSGLIFRFKSDLPVSFAPLFVQTSYSLGLTKELSISGGPSALRALSLSLGIKF